MMIAKNQRLTLSCRGLGGELEGVCDHEGLAVFVPGALPGERVEALIVRAAPRYAFGKLLRVLEPSPSRAEPPCPAYALCGGCGGQHMTYAATLEAKRQQVLDCMNRIGGLGLAPADVPPPLAASEPWHCRNKTALPVGGTADSPLIGFYRRRSHDIVDVADCPVAMGDLAGTLRAVREWMAQSRVAPYDEATGRGLLRHVITRANRAGGLMVLLVAARDALPDTDGLVKLLKREAKGFESLHLSVQPERNNVILGRDSRVLWGRETIRETLLGLVFEVAPLSFFQVNPAQTEGLYRAAVGAARLRPTDVVVDAYAGAGTISLYMAGAVRQVVGIEIVPQAVESAERNAALNGVRNATFRLGATEDILPKLVADGLRPDVLMLDPPRKGVEPPVIAAALAARPRRVVYVSCHPPTQARDAKLLLEGGYRFESCQPVDMFCWAGGVENVLTLVREDE